MHSKRASKVPEPTKDFTVTVTPLEVASRPPSYYSNQEVDLTAAFSTLNLTRSPDAELPTADTCLAHLKLLRAFQTLRDSVETRDGVFKIWDAFNPHTPSTAQHEQVALTIRHKRWAVYVSKAVQRFHKWWSVAVLPAAQKLKAETMGNELTRFVYDGNSMKFDVQDLPPLDVLMVWHAYHLNPRAFLEDSLRHGKLDFWRAGFPWEAVNASIDNNTFAYQGTRYATASWAQRTGLAWDLLDDSDDAVINCPSCKKDMSLPWTSYTRGGDMWQDSEKLHEELSQGFADKSMSFNCPFCQSHISHDVLKIRKFWDDFVSLADDGVAMPGTILNMNGIPDPVHRRKQTSFPNRLLLADEEFRERLRKLTQLDSGCTVSDIRTEIESLLSDKITLYKARDTADSRLTRDERIAIRRMMSAYWNSFSPYFSLDLVGAVIRQCTFIQKMTSLNWLHSPSARFTMDKLLIKYERYIAVIASHPTHVAVPTLDVDLAWHTHQLCSPQYYKYVEWNTTKFIDHDDKIDEVALSDAFEWTTKTYQKKYHEVYSECVCWYCECVREASSSASSNLKSAFGMKKGGDAHIEAQLANLHRNAEVNGPHISAHSTIKPAVDGGRNKTDEKQTQHLQQLYSKISKKATKAGRTAPARSSKKPGRPEDERDDAPYAAGGIWPLYIAPYQSDPSVAGDHYSQNPACASFAAGAQGNCCQGSCGGGVAAGACAGGGMGGCSSGGAGACGGGGGSSGGCGGGGGF